MSRGSAGTGGTRSAAHRTLRVLLRLTAINLTKAFIYRGDMMVFALSGLTLPVVSLMIWQAALLSGADFPVDRHYLGTYFVLLGLVSMLTSSWLCGFLAREIRLGDLSRWLVRPASALLTYISNNIAEKALKVVVVVPAVGALWLLFRDVARFPADPGVWLLFTVSVVLALVIVLAIEIAIAALAFWIDEPAGIQAAQMMIAGVLSGTLVPLALMPESIRGVVEVQPWRFTVSFPIEIVIGGLSRSELVLGFGLQLAYAFLLCLCARAIWKRGLRSYTAVGA